MVDGVPEPGYFASDFTLAEIRRLRAVQPFAEREQKYNGKFGIPTFREVLALAEGPATSAGAPSASIRRPSTRRTTRSSACGSSSGWSPPWRAPASTARGAPVFIQSFEQSNLKLLNRITPVRLVQLVDANDVNDDGTLDYTRAVRPAVRLDGVQPAELRQRTFGFFATDAGLAEVATYADGIGPWKRYIVPTTRTDANGDGTIGDEDGDGRVDEGDREIAPATDLVDRAHDHGLLVHTWTFRNEARRLAYEYEDDPIAEYLHFFALGVDGVFSDFPDTAVAARAAFLDD